ncbi:hypothetical protein OJ997_18545 [Solirubrobacter phytolaccae]|uniref:Uncharacterized protein n=1 Tax=Solirubrobacter phytolaccae TaxID=1404360 RepID=A0A9X3S956_9ACTN|nr:hypothetical protein [Solirubrobacter phytolaccae]MDA0182313.1 hypothetical protein [Solirubrobacter phytolaccae]
MAAIVAANPASAAEGNGWSCISPFANYTNGTYQDDPPALNHILDSLAIDVTRTLATPLTAVAGQALPLQDLQLRLEFKDTRPAEQMYKRTGGISYSYSGIPVGQTEDNSRSFSNRVNPADQKNYWSYNTGTNAAPNWVYAQEIVNAGQPPRVRLADADANTTWTYATPNVSLGHRYLSHTGNSQFPIDAWVTVAASNTVEGVQTLPVKGNWTINIKDATPGTPANPSLYANDDVVATVPPVVLNLPTSRWTPTGAGPVEFTIAQPGKLGIIQVESKGYDRVGYNTPLNIRPYGSVYVRAQTEAYGASNDCIPGQISLANGGIASGQQNLLFGDADPTVPDPALGDPSTPGKYYTQNGQSNAVGSRGRFALAFTALPAIATAPLPVAPVPVPAPAPAPKPATFGSASSIKASKTGAVKLALTNPNAAAASYKVSAKTVSKYATGKSKTKKVVTVAATKTVALNPGASNVNLSLSATGKALLKKQKSLKVKVTLTPTSGGAAITKTITLKRA